MADPAMAEAEDKGKVLRAAGVGSAVYNDFRFLPTKVRGTEARAGVRDGKGTGRR